MAGLTPISRKPASVYVATTAAFGALAGLFIGTAQGSGPLGKACVERCDVAHAAIDPLLLHPFG